MWTKPENQSVNPCFVVAPQCPENALWTTLDKADPTDQLRLVLELIENLRKTFNIDGKRLYVAGQSMGGFGAWALISEQRGVFAAAVPVCGGGDESKASRLVNTAVWAFHGDEDAAVRVARSRDMIAAIRKAGGEPKVHGVQGRRTQ